MVNNAVNKVTQIQETAPGSVQRQSVSVVVSDAVAGSMNMNDEIKVTVVATGLGGVAMRPNVVVDNTRAPAVAAPAPAMNGEVNYAELDRPAVMRRQSLRPAERSIDTAAARQIDDYLDIPAFLRRQVV